MPRQGDADALLLGIEDRVPPPIIDQCCSTECNGGLRFANPPTHRYLPLNCGFLFSMNACRPSRKSSESIHAVPMFLIASMSRLSGSFNTCAMVIFAA